MRVAYVSEIADLIKGTRGKSPKNCLEKHFHKIKYKGPVSLLSQARQWLKRYPHTQGLGKKIAYLQKFEMQIKYLEHQTA